MRRLGNPRTDDERLRRHLALYGTADLPERGTGLRYASAVALLMVIGLLYLAGRNTR